MLPTPDGLLWEAFSADTETVPVGGVEVRVLGRTALALHVVVHAVQHGFKCHTDEDLRRAITVMSADEWRPVADLAARLGIAGILGFGLRHHAAGAEIADRLTLPPLSPADPWAWMLSAPRGSASLTEFWSAPTLRAKVRRIRRTLLPSPAWIRHVSRLSRSSRAQAAARLRPMVARPRASRRVARRASSGAADRLAKRRAVTDEEGQDEP